MDSPTTQRGRVRAKGWTRVTRGAHRTVDGSAVEAWQLVLPVNARFTHLTAAAVLGWWLPPLPDELPVIIAIERSTSRPVRPALHVLRQDPAVPPRTHEGLLVDAPAEVLLSCAHHLSSLDLVVLIDGALHRGDVTLDELWQVAGLRRRGNRSLRSALEIADGRSESPWETVLRLMHQTCGAEVEPQRELRSGQGDFVARADLWLVGTTSIHEYDGGVHLERSQQRADLARARRLSDAGWTRRGYTSQDVLRTPIGILRDIDRALGREHDPSRIRAWHALLAQSLFTESGTTLLMDRLRRARSPRGGLRQS